MTSNYGHGYVNGPRTGQKYSTESCNRAKYVKEEDLGSSVQYDSIDYDILSKSERAQDKHIYLDLNNDKRTNKVTTRRHHEADFGRGASNSSLKTTGRWKFVVIIVVLLILLIGVAIAFGILYFKKNEVSPTNAPPLAKRESTSKTEEITTSTTPSTKDITTSTTPSTKDITTSTTPSTKNITTSTTPSTKNITTSTTPSTKDITTNQTTKTDDIHTRTTSRASTSTETFNIIERCKDYDGMLPHPEECQAYYNCSNFYSNIPAYYEQYMMECHYPRLFSTDTMTCEHFEKVTCGERKEAKSECAYRRSWCVGGHCIPCYVYNPGCEGKPDGYNVYTYKEWTPYYAICYKERTILTETCPPAEGYTQFYSPDFKACVSLFRIPSGHGGFMPNCTDKADGVYPNEGGPCDHYTVCAWGQYHGTRTCSSSEEVFDEVLKTCRNRTEASYCTCGRVGCE